MLRVPIKIIVLIPYIKKSLSCKILQMWYSKTCLKQNLKGPEYFSAKARFPFNQGTLHRKIIPGHAHI